LAVAPRKEPPRRAIAAGLLVLACLAGGAGSGGDDDNNGGGPACQPPDPTTVSLATNIQPIFDASCAVAGCHLGPAPAFGLDLSPGNTFDDTVGVKSNQRNQLDLVKAGDPDASYLVRKCEGGPDIAGVLMPQGCGLPGTGGTGDNGALCLSNDDIAAIRQWILECATDN
jgi:hypothetical protein